MAEPQTNLLTDRWVAASWEDHLQTIADPTHEKAKGYYY